MPRWLPWLSAALLALGLARVLWVTQHEPMLAYANQFDMHRTGACLGLYPLGSLPPHVGSPRAPDSRYVRGARNPQLCYPGTAVVLAGVGAGLHDFLRPDAVLTLRWVGAVAVGVLAASILAAAFALRRHPRAAFMHACAVFVVVGDASLALWFNTLYTEPAILLGIYALVVAVVLLALGERRVGWPMAVIGIAALAFAREQFAWLPAVLALAAWPFIGPTRRAGALLVGIAVVAGMLSYFHVPRDATIRASNRVNAYLAFLIPSMADPARASKTIRLPERCAPALGASWYDPRGLDLQAACPEALRLSSTAFLRLAALEPGSFLRALLRGTGALTRLSPPHLGMMEGNAQVVPANAPWPAQSPLDAVSRRVDAPTAVLLIAFAGLVAAAAGSKWIGAWIRRSIPPVAWVAPLLLALITLYAFATSLLGDGLSEAARHFLAGQVAVFAGAVLGLAAVVIAPRRVDRGAIVVMGILLGGIVLHEATAWALARQPLAIGAAAGFPVTQPISRAPLQVLGWALDPAGIARVDVTIGERTRSARLGGESLDVLDVYPAYPDAARAYFAAQFPAEDLSTLGAIADMRVDVINAAGTVTTIDRRRLRVAP